MPCPLNLCTPCIGKQIAKLQQKSKLLWRHQIPETHQQARSRARGAGRPRGLRWWTSHVCSVRNEQSKEMVAENVAIPTTLVHIDICRLGKKLLTMEDDTASTGTSSDAKRSTSRQYRCANNVDHTLFVKTQTVQQRAVSSQWDRWLCQLGTTSTIVCKILFTYPGPDEG